MFRVHFSAEDLARTRVVAGYGPYAEALFSLGALRQSHRSNGLFDGWRQQVQQAHGQWADLLGPVVGDPPVLDLFTLMGRVSSSQEGSAALLGASKRTLRREVEDAATYVAAVRPGRRSALPMWAFRLADDRAVRSAFVAALRDCYQAAVDPYWNQIRAHLDAELGTQTHVLGAGGIGLVLATLHPQLRWRDSTLEILHWTGRSTQAHLNGRGMALVPSVFCRTVRIYTNPADPSQPWLLFYPAIRDITDASRLWAPHAHPCTDRALACLLGTTRARALGIISDNSATTTELARRLRVSEATASHHATVLRQTGLTTTRRHGRGVLHTISPLGTALLNGAL